MLRCFAIWAEDRLHLTLCFGIWPRLFGPRVDPNDDDDLIRLAQAGSRQKQPSQVKGYVRRFQRCWGLFTSGWFYGAGKGRFMSLVVSVRLLPRSVGLWFGRQVHCDNDQTVRVH